MLDIAKLKENCKRIIETIKWLLNHPPTNVTSDPSVLARCDYCGGENDLWAWTDFSYCKNCLKKVMDKNLKKKGKAK